MVSRPRSLACLVGPSDSNIPTTSKLLAKTSIDCVSLRARARVRGCFSEFPELACGKSASTEWKFGPSFWRPDPPARRERSSRFLADLAPAPSCPLVYPLLLIKSTLYDFIFNVVRSVPRDCDYAGWHGAPVYRRCSRNIWQLQRPLRSHQNAFEERIERANGTWRARINTPGSSII